MATVSSSCNYSLQQHHPISRFVRLMEEFVLGGSIVRRGERGGSLSSTSQIPAYFSIASSSECYGQVLSSLSEHEKTIIRSYDFESLLLFDSTYVPKKISSIIFGLPLGGLKFGKDFDGGKQFILLKYGLSCLPSVRFFGDQFIKREQISNDQVLYLDHVEFGMKNVGNSTPHISIWIKGMIQSYFDIHKVHVDNYGLRPLRDFKYLCYYQPQPGADIIISFKDKLESTLGSVLPCHMKGKLYSLITYHYSKIILMILEDVQDFDNGEGRFENVIDDINVEVSNELATKCDDNIIISTPKNRNVDASIPNDDVRPTYFANYPFVNPFSVSTPVVTPQDIVLRSPKLSASATVAAIHNVAKKFKSRLQEYNNQSARNKIYDLSRPSFKLIDCDDDFSCSENITTNKSNQKDSEDDGDNNLSTVVPCIYFRTAPDTPDTSNFNNITCNENSGRTHQSSQNFSK
uniref:Uncharacterized protein n=1 Tax=Oryza punctata TaxID=4537 RepID=A0A0E0LJ68_ORYPU